MNLPAHIQSKIKVCQDTGCWLWTGCKDRDGYGKLKRSNGVVTLAHKVIYELACGPVPREYELDHFTCSRRDCVNPRHLKAVSHKDNLLRSTTTLNAINAAKRECPKCCGPYSFRNNGFRFCRPCASARQKANYESKKFESLNRADGKETE